MFLPKAGLFSISLLVCKFYKHKQTCYQNFLGTYPPLSHLLDGKVRVAKSYVEKFKAWSNTWNEFFHFQMGSQAMIIDVCN